MSRPSRCDQRTGHAKVVAARRRRPLPNLRLSHLYTSWTSYTGWCCSWCGIPFRGNRPDPTIVAGGTYLRCEQCECYHHPNQHVERIR